MEAEEEVTAGVLTSEYPSMQIGQLTVPEGLEHSASGQWRANADIGLLAPGDILCAAFPSKNLL